MATRVDIQHLSKSFGSLRAVEDVTFSVDKGEVLGFLGPNGAGKSTTMKMVTGFLTPTSGTAVVCGHDVLTAPIEVKRCLGYLPEGAPAYGEMTPATFLDFCAGVRGISGSDKAKRIESAVERTQLGGVLKQRIETLSKGFKRRVGLAQAILHDPPVLVLDEPTDGLDPNQKHEVRELIRGMAEDKVIILSTHILEEVDAVCTRAIIIAQGRVLADGTPGELEARSKTHNALSVAVRADAPDGVPAALGDIDGVDRLESLDSSNGVSRLRVFPRKGADVAAEIARRVRESGWDLEELHQERGRLDEVFRQITTDGADA